MMKGSELAKKAIDIAKNYKTLYVMGCFGAPMTSVNKKRWIEREHYQFNNRADRTEMINAASSDTFGFDCVNLIKGIVWGWCGDQTKTYGGAQYKTNGCPDYSADRMIQYCEDVTSDFSKDIPVGAALWCSGHIGIYIGDGLAVECTPKWKNCVQVTAVGNIGRKTGYNARVWSKWGLMPFIDYEEGTISSSEPVESTYQVGDVVMFTGTKHYTSSMATNGKSCRPGKAKITAIARTGKHPLHLVAVAGQGSNVYGWVDVASVVRESPNLVVGSRVKLKAGAKTYTGGKLLSFVYKKTYDVLQISGDRVVIGVGTTVTAAVNKKDLTIV